MIASDEGSKVETLRKMLTDTNVQVVLILIGSHLMRFNHLYVLVTKLLLDELSQKGILICFDRPSYFYSRMFKDKVLKFKNLTYVDTVTNISSMKDGNDGAILCNNPFEGTLFSGLFEVLGKDLSRKYMDKDDTCFEPVDDDMGDVDERTGLKGFDFIMVDNLNSSTYYVSQKKVENFLTGLIDFISNLTKTRILILANTDSNPSFYRKIKELCEFEMVL